MALTAASTAASHHPRTAALPGPTTEASPLSRAAPLSAAPPRGPHHPPSPTWRSAGLPQAANQDPPHRPRCLRSLPPACRIVAALPPTFRRLVADAATLRQPCLRRLIPLAPLLSQRRLDAASPPPPCRRLSAAALTSCYCPRPAAPSPPRCHRDAALPLPCYCEAVGLSAAGASARPPSPAGPCASQIEPSRSGNLGNERHGYMYNDCPESFSAPSQNEEGGNMKGGA